jgi:hypothetical protein
VIYEALVALQKIRDESAGPAIQFRLRDLDQKVQIAAIQTTGVLLNKAAVPDLIDVLNRAKSMTVKREALTAIAMLPEPSSRHRYETNLHDKDDRLNSASYNGVAYPFLVELARDAAVRQALYVPLASGTKDEKIYLARVLARSGDSGSVGARQRPRPRRCTRGIESSADSAEQDVTTSPSSASADRRAP